VLLIISLLNSVSFEVYLFAFIFFFDPQMKQTLIIKYLHYKC